MNRWKYQSRESLDKPRKNIYNINRDRNDQWGEKLRQSLLLKDIQDEQMEMKILNEPIRFIAPYAEGRKSKQNETNKRSGLDKNNKEINLMELNTTRGRQEIKTDLEGKNTSFTVTAKRPDKDGLLSENMRVFDRNTAKKQRRTSDINLFLARGKKEDAASVEFELNRKWTDQRMKLVQGEGKSRMLEVMCPYADDAKERSKIFHIRQELETVREMRTLMQSQRSQGIGLAENSMEDLKRQESLLQTRLEELNHLVDKKNYVKRLMLQKYRYAVHPTGDRKFFAGFRSADASYNKAAMVDQDMAGTGQEDSNNLASDIYGSEEDNIDSKFGDGAEE